MHLLGGAGLIFTSLGILMIASSVIMKALSISAQESERILRGFISQALFENGIYCRTDDRGDPVVQLAPALIANETQFNEIESILRNVLAKANSMV